MDWGSGRRVATFLRQKFYSTNNQGLGGGISEGSVGGVSVVSCYGGIFSIYGRFLLSVRLTVQLGFMQHRRTRHEGCTVKLERSSVD